MLVVGLKVTVKPSVEQLDRKILHRNHSSAR